MKSPLSSSFSRSLVLSFTTVLFLAPFLHHALLPRPATSPVRSVASAPDYGWLGKLSVSQDLLIRESDPASIKKQQAWWLADRSVHHERSTGIRINGDAGLFGELFPNYGETVRLAADFWDEYFENSFQSMQFFPSLHPERMGVATSSLGCLDLLSWFGGDYVIMGNSETMWDIVPKTFASKLSGPRRRVGPCARSAHAPEAILASTKYLEREFRSRNHPKLKAVVLGFSQMWGYPDSRALIDYDRVSEQEFAEYTRRRKHFSPPGWLAWKGKENVQLPQWTRFLPINWSSLHQSEQSASVFWDMLGQSKNLKIPPGGLAHDVSIMAINRDDLPILPRIVNNEAQRYFIYDGIEKVGCKGLGRLETQARKLAETLARVADDVYIFLTPITRSHELEAPACLRSGVKNILESLQSPHVHILTQEKDFYGLNEKDFVYYKSETQLYFDPNHLNFEGAKKVSVVLAKWVAKN
jgi:hypothetical protein